MFSLRFRAACVVCYRMNLQAGRLHAVIWPGKQPLKPNATRGIHAWCIPWCARRAPPPQTCRAIPSSHTHTLIPPREDQCEWHRMTRMTGPDCVVMCNLINTHTHTHMRERAPTQYIIQGTRWEKIDSKRDDKYPTLRRVPFGIFIKMS